MSSVLVSQREKLVIMCNCVDERRVELIQNKSDIVVDSSSKCLASFA